MPNQATYILAVDADGCLFNWNCYRNILVQIVNKNWDNIYQILMNDVKFPINEFIDTIYQDIKIHRPIDLPPTQLITNTHLIQKLDEAWHACNRSDYKQTQAYDDALNGIIKEMMLFFQIIDENILKSLIVNGNYHLISYAVSQQIDLNKAIATFTIVSASNRQSYTLDQLGNETNGTYSFFKGLKLFASGIGAHLSNFCMADIYNNLTRGESYKQILDEKNEHDIDFRFPETVFDENKVSLLYALVHDACCHILPELNLENDAKIVIEFVDNDNRILHRAFEFFKNAPSLIPKQVTLNFTSYDGVIHDELIRSVSGTGEVDNNFKDNVKLMVIMSGGRLNQYTGSIDVATHLNVKDFLAHRILIPYIHPLKLSKQPLSFFNGIKSQQTTLAIPENTEVAKTLVLD